jgi:hypothetical protein
VRNSIFFEHCQDSDSLNFGSWSGIYSQLRTGFESSNHTYIQTLSTQKHFSVIYRLQLDDTINLNITRTTMA